MTTYNSRPLPGAAAADQTSCEPSIPQIGLRGEARIDCLAAALEYAALGVHVFPLTLMKKPLRRCNRCLPPGGCPGREQCRCGVDTCHGFYAATTDLEKLQRWWGAHPDWQLGIRTGRQSGLVVLDVDLDKGGLDSLIALQAVGLSIEGAAVQISGSGNSFHLIFSHPGGHVPCSQGRLGPGLDVRGDGGYVVGAPSLHASTGAPYELLGELTGLPPWRPPPEAERSRRGRKQCSGIGAVSGTSTASEMERHVGLVACALLTGTRREALVRTVRSAPEGSRRSSLFWAACRLGESAGSQTALAAAAQDLLQAALDAGMLPDKAYTTLRDGLLVGRSA